MILYCVIIYFIFALILDVQFLIESRIDASYIT